MRRVFQIGFPIAFDVFSRTRIPLAMSFRSNFLTLLSLVSLSLIAPKAAHAQSAVLAEIYGRGVHAYNSGQYQQAGEWLSMAINNGYRDPRAYYFRGLTAAASGRGYEAESDFQQGAELEASGTFGNVVGRSLSRIQGSVRIQLEQIRERARLQALAVGQARSNVRYGELGVAPAAPVRRSAPAAAFGVSPPAAPAGDNPFADDLDEDPTVDSMDAFKGAMDNAASPADGGGTADAPTGGGDPFGSAPDAGSDPFGTGGSAPADDPFAAPGGDSDPFGGGGDSDPFGASPF